MLVVGATVLALVSGCASRRQSFAQRFVKPGTPTVTYDAAAVEPPRESLAEYGRRLRSLQAMPRTKASLLPTIESQDPRLAAALMALAVQESSEHHRAAAAAYLAAGVRDYAYRHYQRALRLEPCDSAAHEGVARLWRDWGMPDLALGDVYRAIHCRPQSASAHNTLGTILLALGQRANARKAFDFVLLLDRTAAYALNNLCYLSLEEGNPAAAERECARALQMDPTLRPAQTNLALAFAMQGDVARAERRLLDGPDLARSRYDVGVLRMSLGNYREAAEAFEAALEIRPTLAAAARRAAQAREYVAAQREP